MDSQSLLEVNELLDMLERGIEDSKSLPNTFKHIAQAAQTFFHADTVLIFPTSPINGKFIDTTTIVGNLPATNKAIYERLKLQELKQRVLQEGILIVTANTTPEYQSIFTQQEDISCIVALPLRMKYQQKPLGVLYINFSQLRKFSDYDHKLFQLFADQASFILQEIWLLQRYQEVARIGQEINQDLSTAENLFSNLQNHISNILDISNAFLLAVYQPQMNTLDLYMKDEGQFVIKENDPLEGACGYVISTQETIFVQQASKEAASLPFQQVKISTKGGVKESFIFVPLVFREVSLGVLSIQHEQQNAYDHEDLFILGLLANHIALALYNTRLYDNLSRLSETGQLLTQQLDSDQVLQATVDKIREATKADIVMLYPYEAATKRFIVPPRIAGDLYASSRQSVFPSRPDDLTLLTLHHDDPIFAKHSGTIYAELQGDPRLRQGNFQEREKVRSTAALSLRAGNVAVGVLFINFRHIQRFDASQKLLIEGLGHYAAIAIKNAQEYRTLIQRRIHELEILRLIDHELNRNLHLESILQTLLDLAYEYVPAEEAAITLYNPQTQVLEFTVVRGRRAEVRRKLDIQLQDAKGITRWVLEHKKSVRVANVHQDPLWQKLYFQTTDDTLSELDVPLRDGDEVIGVLNFESTKEGAFRQEDEDFLLTLAGQATLAIKNAQAYEREKRFAAEGKVLNEISKEIIAQLDTTHIFDLILEKALELTNASNGVLMLYDPDRDDLEMAAERGVMEERKGQRLHLDEGVIGYVARTKKLLNVSPFQAPWNEIYLDYIPGTRSDLVVPMLEGNELRGIIDVESPAPKNFKENDERLLESLADLAVVALQHAQTYEREKRFADEARVLNEISKEIISQLDPFSVFDQILQKALEVTNSTSGTLELYDPDRNDLEMVAERGVIQEQKGLRLSLDQGVVGHVARHKQALNINPSEPPWNEIFVPSISGTRSELAVPMLAGSNLRGVINIESPLPDKFTESDGRLLHALADLAVVALQNAERYEQAEKSAQSFELLYQAGKELGEITESAQLERAYEIILQIAQKQSKSQVVIRRFDEETQTLDLILESHHQEFRPFPSMRLDEGLNGQVAREKRIIGVHDIHHPPLGVSVTPSDPTTQSIVVLPIKFKNRYYGNLGFSNRVASYFRDSDINFYEGLVQQLASTIYRLEIADARQELEQRTLSAEEMSSIGQSAFEITHRLGNDLGLVESYVKDIESELEQHIEISPFIGKKLDNIVKAVRTVLDLSGKLKEELARSGATEKDAGGPIFTTPDILFEQALDKLSLPMTIEMQLEVDTDVAAVRVIPRLITHILRNLINNAIEAMPAGGKLVLRARNIGRSVALEVSDTGVGIPTGKTNQIFDLFFSTKRSSGFGLWSARRYALRNHGELKVDSQPGQGTTFTLLLPRTDEDEGRIL